MKEVNDKKESMKPMSQAAVELDDEALDQGSGGLKRLDSDWKPEITEVCCKIVFDIVDKPVCIYLGICRACNQLLGNRLSLFIGNLIHIFENRSKRKLDHLESIALTKDLGITDKTLDSKCRL